MAKKIMTLVMLMIFAGGLYAQQPDTTNTDEPEVISRANKAEPQKKKFVRPKFFDHTYVGGGLGLQFGSYTVLDLSPLVAYEVGKVFMFGVGATYLYARIKYPNYIQQNNMYGGRVFVRLLPARNVFSNGDAFFIHGEFEVLNVESPNQTSIVIPQRYNVPGYIAGAGYQQAIGRRAFTYLSLLWNFNANTNPNRPYPYNNPLLRFGVLIGI